MPWWAERTELLSSKVDSCLTTVQQRYDVIKQTVRKNIDKYRRKTVTGEQEEGLQEPESQGDQTKPTEASSMRQMPSTRVSLDTAKPKEVLDKKGFVEL